MTQRYSAYKDSGVEWIGEIPTLWVVKKMKYGVSNPSIKILPAEGQIKISPEYVETDTGVCTNFYSDYEGEGFRFIKGDILLNKLRIYLKKILFADYDGISMGEMIVLRCNESLYNRYFYFMLFNQGLIGWLNAQSTGVKMPRVAPEVILNSEIIYPPIYEQSQIVEFLDAKTALIDRLVDVKQRRIELLKEKRAALINHAVTKGLDPNVKMKDSGIEWIGEIPEHWKVTKVKWAMEFLNNRRIPLYAEERELRQGEFKYYGASGVIDYIDDYLFDGEYILVGEDGANILNRSTPLVFLASGKFWVNNHAHILRNYSGVISFFELQLEVNDFSTIASGSAQPKLTKEALADTKLFLPPEKEQQQIANYLNSETKKIDDLVALEQKKIDLLKEYRQALISETVTGKIKVTND